jgi:hypothetical protein
MFVMKLVSIFCLSLVRSYVLIKRAGVGYSGSGVRMTYYGSDYSQSSNGKWIGDVPPYAPYGTGACGQEPVDKNYFVAMNDGAFSGSCGLCAKVTYGGKCVVAPIVDMCPGCGSGIDMSLHAFGELVGGEAKARDMGIASVNFEIVRCPRNRASTGSSSFADSDPCSGSSSGGSAPSSSGSTTTTSSARSSSSTSTISSSQSTSTTSSSQSTSSTISDESTSTTSSSQSASTASSDESASTTTGAKTTSGSGTGCGADGTLYGFPCCTYAANIRQDWVDKNGYVYGWEDKTTCIVPK